MQKLLQLSRSIYVGIIACLLSGKLLATDKDALSVDAAFNFIDFQTMQVKLRGAVPTDKYIVHENTNVEINEMYSFRKLRAYLHSNALAAMVFTHRGIEENNKRYLDKAAGIFRTFIEYQYTSEVCTLPVNRCNNFPHLAGAFPHQLVSEDYYEVGSGATTPYTGESALWMVRHGSNGRLLMALGYYTLKTGDRSFVSALRKLADYLISDRAQVNAIDSHNHGAILFGWGNPIPPRRPNYRMQHISTEHQTEVFAGLLYAAEVMQGEAGQAERQRRYLESATSILRFSLRKLYNPNHQRADGKDGTFFHLGLDSDGRSSLILPSIDTQALAYLAFSRALVDIMDVSCVLDYAWEHMYGDNPDPDEPPGVGQVLGASTQWPPVVGRGALWYEGDAGIWLTGSAQLGQACSFAHRLTGKEAHRIRADIVSNDLRHLVWLEDAIQVENRTWSWPQGGLPEFSDDYRAHAEPFTLGKGQKMPSTQPTVWHYFGLVGFNPYAIELGTQLPAPRDFQAKDVGVGVELSWRADPLAVSYIIERDDLDAPLIYVSNLNNAKAKLSVIDTQPQCVDCSYTVRPRDVSGQLGHNAETRMRLEKP